MRKYPLESMTHSTHSYSGGKKHLPLMSQAKLSAFSQSKEFVLSASSAKLNRDGAKVKFI
jgi:hypothetical protein